MRILFVAWLTSALALVYLVFQTNCAPVEEMKSKLSETRKVNELESFQEDFYKDSLTNLTSLPSWSSFSSLTSNNTTSFFKRFPKFFNKIGCSACKYLVGMVKKMLNKKVSFDTIAAFLGEACYLAKIYDENVCKGATHVFKEEVLTVFSMVALSPSEVCGFLDNQCGSSYNPFDQHWNISIPGNKPPVFSIPTPHASAPVTRILQLTDLHFDSLYTAGLTNQCNEPLCCRPPNAKGQGKNASGKWGDYLCDVPPCSIISLFKHLQTIQDTFDWIYWTGDITAHNIWAQTRTKTLEHLDYFYGLFEQFLPDKMVFPVFGNHDTVPVNSFPQPFITGNQSTSWIVEPVLGYWKKWLSKFPDWNTTQDTIRWGGYYNVRVGKSLRIIGLQTTYCENKNFWLYVNATDPAGQLQWLVEQLLEAEKAGDKVHIVGHHPPGMFDSVHSYGDNYKRIVNRFESTITGQFFGHTHADSFKLYMDDSNTRPTSVMYISPGITSYQGYNYGFRIYTVDGNYSNSTHYPLDHETYIFDLDQANYHNNPNWTFLYSAKAAYNLTSLHPEILYQFWKTMHSSNTAFQLFCFHFYKGRATSGTWCNKSGMLCDIVTTSLHYNPLCSDTASVQNFGAYYAPVMNVNMLR